MQRASARQQGPALGQSSWGRTGREVRRECSIIRQSCCCCWECLAVGVVRLFFAIPRSPPLGLDVDMAEEVEEKEQQMVVLRCPTSVQVYIHTTSTSMARHAHLPALLHAAAAYDIISCRLCYAAGISCCWLLLAWRAPPHAFRRLCLTGGPPGYHGRHAVRCCLAAGEARTGYECRRPFSCPLPAPSTAVSGVEGRQPGTGPHGYGYGCCCRR